MKLASLVRFAAMIAWRRTIADWRLQLAAAFGVVLAVALMASGVIYSHALEETALRYTLRTASEEDVNLTVRVFHALELPAFSATRRFIEERVEGPIAPHLADTVLLVQTSTLFIQDLPGADTSKPTRARVTLQSVTDLEEHSTLLEGRYPDPAIGEVEVVTDPQGASLLGLSLGQTFNVFSALTENEALTVPVRVVGITEPVDPTSQYWSIGARDRSSKQTQSWVSLSLYANTIDLLSNIEDAIPNLNTDFVWLFDVDQDGIRASEARSLRASVEGIINELRTNLPNSSWSTDLDGVLKRYAALLVVARIPLFLVLFLAVGVLLYYLFLIAGLLGRLRAQEVAMFRSRGASTWQVGIVILIEGLIMAAPAIAVGPFLAQLLVKLTGRLFPGAANSPSLDFVDLSLSVFLLGAVGAILAVVVLSATTLSAARQGMVAFRSSIARPPEMPLFLRYYLDVALLVIIGLLWWQLKSRGSFLINPVSGGEVSIDITLLLGPVLGALAVGLLLLRVFPIVMRIVARIVDPIGSVWLVQALRKVGRDPVPTGSIMVLIALATALGVLSSAVLSTLERSQRDQALYEAGADILIQHNERESVASDQSPAKTMVGLTGVEQTSDVMRIETRASTASFGESVVLLGVETDKLADVAWYRPDLAGGPLEEVLGSLAPKVTEPQGIPLPPETTALGIWVSPGRVSGSPVLFARLQDSKGTYFDTRLGELTGTEWYHLQAPIDPLVRSTSRNAPPPPVVEPPYTLHTLWVASDRRRATIGTVFMDQLQAIVPAGAIEIESFQSIDKWHPLEDPLGQGLYSLGLSESVARPGRRSAVFMWGRGGLAARGIRIGPPEEPLPVLVSPNFLDAGEVKEDDDLFMSLGDIQAPVRIVGDVPYFPTLYPLETPFALIDLDSVMRYISLHGVRPRYPSTEIWVRSNGGGLSAELLTTSLDSVGSSASKVQEAAQLVAERVSDPLLTAGWSGLLALSFVAVVLASASGLLLYTYIDAREHVGEFAILRTLGFTNIQVNGVLWFNLTLTVILGALLGTWGGQMLGTAVLPLLEVAEGGRRVTPPMVLESNWAALLVSYGVLATTTVITVGALAWAISKLEVQKILRVAEA